jgi:hypothetical protein
LHFFDAATIRDQLPWPRVIDALAEALRADARPTCATHPRNADEISVFKSVGFALDDLAPAEAVFEAALKHECATPAEPAAP